jgi:hypothetical protein
MIPSSTWLLLGHIRTSEVERQTADVREMPLEGKSVAARDHLPFVGSA